MAVKYSTTAKPRSKSKRKPESKLRIKKNVENTSFGIKIFLQYTMNNVYNLKLGNLLNSDSPAGGGVIRASYQHLI